MKIESILEKPVVQACLAVTGVGLAAAGFYLLVHAAAAAAIAGAIVMLVAAVALAAIAAHSAWKEKSVKKLAPIVNRYESIIAPVGIANRGNTCFAAAYLQLLFGNEAFIALCKKLPPRHPVHDLLNQYTQRQSGAQNAIQTEKLRAFLYPNQSRIASIFKAVTSYLRGADASQEDPHELAVQLGAVFDPFLMEQQGRIMVNGIEEQIGINLVESTSNGFRPMMDKQSNLIYQFPLLNLVLSSPRFIDLLNQNQLWESPSSLLFSVGRYTPELREQPLSVPLIFNMPKEQILNGPAHRYLLQGFVKHSGQDKDKGHYIAYQMHKNQFFCLNDSSVTEISQSEYLKEAEQAYLLNYTKV